MVPPKLHNRKLCRFMTSNAGRTPPLISRGAREWRAKGRRGVSSQHGKTVDTLSEQGNFC